MAAELSSLVARLEAVTERLEKTASGGGGGDAGPSSASVTDYEAFISNEIEAFVSACNDVKSDEVRAMAKEMKQLAQEQRNFLDIVSKSSAPSQADLMKLLSGQSNLMSKLSGRNPPKSEVHVLAIREGVSAFGWVTISPAPGPYIQSMKEAADFYNNKVLREFKDKDWVAKWKQVLDGMQAYVKEHHRTGLSWNKSGPAAKPGAAAPPGVPPPPPAAPVPPPAAAIAPAKSGPNVSALLSDLNKGASVTSGLKKVSDDMKTHKNPNLRLQSAVPYKAPPATKPKPAAKAAQAAVKPAKLALEGKKWIVEYQRNNKAIEITQTEMKHTIYVFRCENSTIQVKGKVNSIVLDGCKKTAVVFDSVVSGIDFINCQSVQAQVKEALPTASIEKTDGCQLYLSKDSLNCQIISAKSSEMNVSIPMEDGEFKEFPIVEQFRTVWNGKALVTEPTENAE